MRNVFSKKALCSRFVVEQSPQWLRKVLMLLPQDKFIKNNFFGQKKLMLPDFAFSKQAYSGLNQLIKRHRSRAIFLIQDPSYTKSKVSLSL